MLAVLLVVWSTELRQKVQLDFVRLAVILYTSVRNSEIR